MEQKGKHKTCLAISLTTRKGSLQIKEAQSTFVEIFSLQFSFSLSPLHSLSQPPYLHSALWGHLSLDSENAKAIFEICRSPPFTENHFCLPGCPK